ncbi:MAG: flavodoxin family protein [Chloroflexota bacterium]
MADILLINGGPRKHGNTMQVAEWVAEGARGQGAQIEIIHLADWRIEHCRGCNACARTGRCCVKDDHAAICEKLDQAQGAIVCSPIFGGSYSAIMKTFFDRLTNIIGFTGRFDHLCTVGITTAKFDDRLKVARELAALNSSWSGSGYVTGYIHKSVLDKTRCRILALAPENSPVLYTSARRLGEKLVRDIEHGQRSTLPWPVRLLFKYLVLPGIGQVLVNHQDEMPFLYQMMQEKSIITQPLLAKHARQMMKLKPGSVSKTTEKVVFCR